MKFLCALTAVLATAAAGRAQEPVDRAEAVKYAAILNLDLDKLADAPLPTDADTKRAFGVKGDKRGGLVVPEAKLSPATLAGAGKDAVPIGQLWLAGLVPARDGQPVATNLLKQVTVEFQGREVALPLCVLGVRKSAGDALELLIYGKDKTPLLAVPMTAAPSEQKWPLEFSAVRESDSCVRVTLNVVGKFSASFSVAAPAP